MCIRGPKTAIFRAAASQILVVANNVSEDPADPIFRVKVKQSQKKNVHIRVKTDR
jgi:hypothetical protein